MTLSSRMEVERITGELLEEARSGLTAVRRVGGWTITVDRAPPGCWVLAVTAPEKMQGYPIVPPDGVRIFVRVLLAAAELPLAYVADDQYNPRTGALKINWTEPGAVASQEPAA
jgi:hypothetical protein